VQSRSSASTSTSEQEHDFRPRTCHAGVLDCQKTRLTSAQLRHTPELLATCVTSQSETLCRSTKPGKVGRERCMQQRITIEAMFDLAMERKTQRLQEFSARKMDYRSAQLQNERQVGASIASCQCPCLYIWACTWKKLLQRTHCGASMASQSSELTDGKPIMWLHLYDSLCKRYSSMSTASRNIQFRWIFFPLGRPPNFFSQKKGSVWPPQPQRVCNKNIGPTEASMAHVKWPVYLRLTT